ncbi:MAG: histidine kinase [Bacteroidales bacterium]
MFKKFKIFGINRIDILLMSFIFLLLFALPVIFTTVDGKISWKNVIKIWQDRALLIPLFLFNHWILVPGMILKKRYKTYIGTIAFIILLITSSYYFIDQPGQSKTEAKRQKENPPPRSERMKMPDKTPAPVPPYADLLMFSLLLVAVDTGMSFTKYWHINEEDKIRLEQENTNVQLAMLRNQLSPHFFMNTLNNIYALIDINTPAAKLAVMKLSKLMRYMLYENESGTVKLSKEFEFIRSYIDLMKLRFAEEMNVHLIIPEVYNDAEIPTMLFISYIENAFKFGASYQHEGFINIVFEIADEKLVFICSNTINSENSRLKPGGLGMVNNENRLNLLFGKNYSLAVNSSEKLFNVLLSIPLK